MSDIVKKEETNLSTETVENISVLMQKMMEPVMRNICKMLEHNTQAMEQIAAAQKMQSDRIAALEKQVRLNTPMTAKQTQYLNDAIRDKAKELLDKRNLAGDKKAVTKLCNTIRRSVLARYGVGSLREIPKHEYTVALSQIGMWSNAVAVQEIVKEARAHAAMADAGLAAGTHAGSEDGRKGHQSGEPGMRGAAEEST